MRLLIGGGVCVCGWVGVCVCVYAKTALRIEMESRVVTPR